MRDRLGVAGAFVVGALAVGLTWALLGGALLFPILDAGSCASHGGRQGAQAQLQYVLVADRAVSFAFVNSSVPGGFDVPEYVSEYRSDGSILVSFRGASTRQPDGTPSYPGPLVIEPGREVVHQVRLVEDADRSMRWRIGLDRAICPRVSVLRYWTGSYSKALVILTFGPVSTVIPEQTARPAKAPVWVNGSGFAASRSVTISLADETVRETAADADGMIETAINVPDVTPGVYVLVARDDAGHSAQTAFTIVPGPWP